jgi:DNA modification methylase
MGSGTTAVACERSERRWVGIERSEDYCRMTVERLEGREEEDADTG